MPHKQISCTTELETRRRAPVSMISADPVQFYNYTIDRRLAPGFSKLTGQDPGTNNS